MNLQEQLRKIIPKPAYNGMYVTIKRTQNGHFQNGQTREYRPRTEATNAEKQSFSIRDLNGPPRKSRDTFEANQS